MLRSPAIPTVDSVQADAIPIWSGSIGSWTVSLGRHPYTAHELKDHYDKASNVWHTTISKLGFEAAYVGLIERALPEVYNIDHTHPLKVLDAGIGTGAFATAFELRCPHAVDLTGVDVSSEMLWQAKQRLQNRGLTAQLLQGDVRSLPFETNTYDVVLVAHVIEHLANPQLALAELHRVLKPGGVLIACVTQRSSAGAFVQLKWRTHRVDQRTAVNWFQRCGLTNVRAIQLASNRVAQRFSVGYVGCKPPQDRD